MFVVGGVIASCVPDGELTSGEPLTDAGVVEGEADLALPELILWLDEQEEVVESPWELVPDDEEGWLVVVEGDLSLGAPADALAAHEEIATSLAAGSGFALNELVMDTRNLRRWSGGTIPYRFDGDLLGDPGRLAAVRRAVRIWNDLGYWTGIRWVERPNLKSRHSGVRFDYVPTSDRCNASVGRYQRRRDINLGDGCFGIRTILHEMGHMMGARHEQQRGDRDRHVYVQFRNGKSEVKSNSVRRNNLPRRYNSIGSYDTESIMHYGSTAFSRNVMRGLSLPTHLNRHELDLMNIDRWSGPPRFARRVLGHNRHIRLGGRGIDLDGVRVLDVDGDGLDDIVAEHEGGIVWSAGGASGWRPVAPGGQTVRAGLGQVALGDITGSGGIDALVVQGRDWTLFGADGTRRTVQRSTALRQIHVADIDGDGISDVFVMHDDRSWSMARGTDVLGPLLPLSSGSMAVNEVKLVRLQGTTGPVHAVGMVNGELSHVNLSSPSGWQRVFLRAGRGPLPSHATSIRHLWFVHVNRDAGPNERIDIVTWSDGRDGSGMPERAPCWVGDVLRSGAIGMQPFAFHAEDFVGIDLRDQVVVGHFASPLRASVITLGVLWQSNDPARSDLIGFGTQYARWAHTRMTDRYPLDASRRITAPYRATVAPNERVELEASFMSAVRLGEVEVVLVRRGRDWRTLLSERRQLSGKTGSVRWIFQQNVPGAYGVSIEPVVRSAGFSDTARWEFTVAGETCGDGFIDHGEACDDGTANSDVLANACRTDCRRARCGDGVVDRGEDCDQGPGNSDEDPDACRTNCRLPGCGDGVLDVGEACDNGVANSDILPDACRSTCELPSCGDGVRDTGEECDDGTANSDTTPDACRASCRLPYCGDGVVDSGEYCDMAAPVVPPNCYMCQWVG
jgi:hypothetical protein